LTDSLAANHPELAGLTIPRHIAVIMDGNGRWAKRQGLPRIQGHFAGRRATRRCVEACVELGVKYLSIYAFSTENWSRPPHEVEGLMTLIETALREEIDDLDANDVRFVASGRLHELSQSLQEAIAESTARTKDNTTLTLNLMVNYGSRAEIVDAARKLAAAVAEGRLNPADIDEQLFTQALYQPQLPDPDLLLRPGGEMRVSNFMLWQIAYAEFVVLPVLWPDFDITHLKAAIIEYNKRQRRFGRVLDTD